MIENISLIEIAWCSKEVDFTYKHLALLAIRDFISYYDLFFAMKHKTIANEAGKSM